ncbi:MAG: DHH family phosphoesterase [Anaerolineae bacterium]|nr:DHH family phosphoesterase [Anaerolineae bacterium]
MTSKLAWQQATQTVMAAGRVLIVTHVKPDGDAIGSMLGLAAALRERGIEVDTAVDGGVPRYLTYLPGAGEVRSALDTGNWDVMISVDASDEPRSGLVGVYGREHSAVVINLDHHPTNTMFGDVQLVAGEAVSSTEVIYDWLVHMQCAISAPVATALLTGLLTDTIGFRTSNVVPRTLEIASVLMQCGAPMYDLIQRTLVSRPYSDLDLWRYALPTMRLNSGIVSVVVSQANLREVGLDESTDGGLVSALIEVDEAQIAIVFKEEPDNTVRLSIRSKPGVDVGTVAFSLGGGGHAQAAGATVPGTLEEVQARVLPLLRAALTQG